MIYWAMRGGRIANEGRNRLLYSRSICLLVFWSPCRQLSKLLGQELSHQPLLQTGMYAQVHNIAPPGKPFLTSRDTARATELPPSSSPRCQPVPRHRLNRSVPTNSLFLAVTQPIILHVTTPAKSDTTLRPFVFQTTGLTLAEGVAQPSVLLLSQEWNQAGIHTTSRDQSCPGRPGSEVILRLVHELLPGYLMARPLEAYVKGTGQAVRVIVMLGCIMLGTPPLRTVMSTHHHGSNVRLNRRVLGR